MDLPENSGKINREPAKRPDMLTFLCILTFIGSGLAVFSYSVMYFYYNEMQTIMDDMGDKFQGMEMIRSLSRQFFLVNFVLSALSLGGAVLMWKLKKAGFHFYAGAQIFILLLPLVFKETPFSIFSVIISASFILGYATNLKYMS